MIEVPFCEYPPCLDFCIDSKVVVTGGLSVYGSIVESFNYVGSGSVRITGSASAAILPKRYIGTGGIVLGGEAGARAHLRLPARRQGDGEAGRHHGALAGAQGQRLVLGDRRAHVAAGGQRSLVHRQLQIAPMGEPLDPDGQPGGPGVVRSMGVGGRVAARG